MKTSTRILFVLIFFAQRIDAQPKDFLISKAAFVNANSLSQKDLMSGFVNCASLVNVIHSQFGLYGEERFMMKENAGVSLFATLKTKFGNFGIDASAKSCGAYTYYYTGIAYAKKLDDKIDAGIRIGYAGDRISRLQKDKFISGKFSLNFHPVSILNVSAEAERFVDISDDRQQSEFHYRFRFGFGYDVSKEFFIGFMIDRQMGEALSVSVGMRYAISKKMAFRFGYSGDTEMISTGIDFAFRDFNLHTFYHRHPQLGFSPGVLISTGFKKQ